MEGEGSLSIPVGNPLRISWLTWGERPAGHTLDRIDNDGPYTPGNCRWSSPVAQGNNRGNNRMITHAGRTKVSLSGQEVGLTRQTLFYRMNHGWSVEGSLIRPLCGDEIGQPSFVLAWASSALAVSTSSR